MTKKRSSQFRYESDDKPDKSQFKYDSPSVEHFRYPTRPVTEASLMPDPTGYWLSTWTPIFLDKVENPFQL